MSSVLVMLGAQMVVKIAGLLYRLVITNIEGFGDVGNGFYNAGFQLYTLLLAISSIGIPSAISILISEAMAEGENAKAQAIFRTALWLFFGIGLCCSLGLYFGADWIALKVIRMDGVQYTLQALSPAILFVCLSSVIRGYFLGLGDVQAASRSQMLEQILKSVLTIVFVLALTAYSAEIMSAGANLATAVAALFSFIYLLFFYLRRREGLRAAQGSAGISAQNASGWRFSFGALAKKILLVSIPVSFSSVVLALGRVIDTGTITRGIAVAFAQGIPGQSGLPTADMLTAEAVRLSGMLAKSDSLINLPLALNVALATVLVPTISAALASGRKREAADKISFSLLVSILLVLPCAVGLIVLAKPVFLLVYPNAPLGWQLLQISAVAMFFAALDQTIFGSLQGMGRVGLPAKALLCGVAVKLVLNVWLIRLPQVNIYGAAISSVACHGLACVICLYHLHKAVPLSLSFSKAVGRPLICNVVMGLVAYGSYQLFFWMSGANALSLLCAIGLAVLGYAAMLFSAGIFTAKELAELPYGAKLALWQQRFSVRK